MDSLTIAIIRRPTDLVALVSEYRQPIAAPAYGDPLDIDPYIERIVKVDKIPNDLSRDHVRELQIKWQRLSAVSEFDATVIQDMSDVLLSTIPEDAHPVVDAWRSPAIPKPSQATAAHPRGFRGTKFQPPSSKKPPSIDLRPFLCSRRDLKAILQYLKTKFPASSCIVGLVEKLDSLELLSAAPVPLRNSLWMSCLCESTDSVKQLIGHYWALDLATNEPLRRVVARIMREPWMTAHRDWLSATRQLPANRRVALLIALLECV